MLAAARSRLERIRHHCDIDEETMARLQHPQRTLAVSIPLRRDDGGLDMLKAWRCQYSDLLGPAKGGIRYHPDVDMEEVMTLAFWMSLKTALAELPYGGGKGGVQVDATSLSRMELQRLSRAYAAAFSSMIGPDRDIPAPDMYTNETVIAWMVDELSQIAGRQVPGAFTGKPVCVGGSQGRSGATAQGAYFVYDMLREQLGIADRSASVAVQGFGNAGAQFSELVHAAGDRVLAVSDSACSLFCSDGLDVPAVTQHKSETGTLEGYKAKGVEQRKRDDILQADVDVLVPAALGGVIRDDNAEDIRARIILEIANGPVRPDADETLDERGIEIVPDILANSGGVIVSYFEWVQNRTGDYWSAEKVRRRLRDRIEMSATRVGRLAEELGLNLRDAANLQALRTLACASQARGTRDLFAS